MPSFESLPPSGQTLQDALGVLIVNLGTPDAPTPRALRSYLKQFLSDPRVVEMSRGLWWLLLNAFVLRVRPARSAALYRKIWTERGSPLLVHSGDLVKALRAALSERLPERVTVELAMSYGNPSIERGLQNLLLQGVGRVAVLPLYPQYSGATTGSAFDAVTRVLSRRRWVPELRFINHYHDAPAYIAALAASIAEFRDRNGGGAKLLFSFHGLPQRMVDDGDPYRRQCERTAEVVAASLTLPDSEWEIGFQSRVGRQEWLQPYTDEILKQWGKSGMDKADVVCPGFAVDCLETLEEIGMRYAELFRTSGGGELRYIPALNARDDHVAFLSSLIGQNVSGWSGTRGRYESRADNGRGMLSLRARDTGAAR